MKKARALALVAALVLSCANLSAWDLKEIQIPGSSEAILWYDDAEFYPDGALRNSDGESVLFNGNNAVIMSVRTMDSSEALRIAGSKNEFVRLMRYAMLESKDPFSTEPFKQKYQDFKLLEEDAVVDYEDDCVFLKATFTFGLDVTGSGILHTMHGITYRILRIIDGHKILDCSIFYPDEMIDGSINLVVDSLLH